MNVETNCNVPTHQSHLSDSELIGNLPRRKRYPFSEHVSFTHRMKEHVEKAQVLRIADFREGKKFINSSFLLRLCDVLFDRRIQVVEPAKEMVVSL